MLLTQKQIDFIKVIVTGNKDGSAIDLDQIIERVEHHPSKQSIHFSIRAMVAKGLIEKGPLERRRGRHRTTIIPTLMGKHFAGPIGSSVISTVEDDEFVEKFK